MYVICALALGGECWMKPERLMTTSDLHVYTGQTLSVLTNGYYRPLLHRAVLRYDRLSMPFPLRYRPEGLNKAYRSESAQDHL